MPFNFLCPQGHWLTGDESQMGQQLQCPVCGSLFIVPVVQQSPPMGWLPGQVPQHPQAGGPAWGPGGPGAVPPAGVPLGVPLSGVPMAGVPGGMAGHAAASGGPGSPAWQPNWPYAAQAGQLPFVPGGVPAGQPEVSEAPLIRTSPEPHVQTLPQGSVPAAFAGPLGERAAGSEVGASGPHAQLGTVEAGPGAPGEAAQASSALAETAPKQEPRILHIPCPKGHELQTPEEMLDQEALCPYCQTQFRLLYKNSTEYKQERERAEQERQALINRLAIKLSIWGVALVLLLVIVLVVLHYTR